MQKILIICANFYSNITELLLKSTKFELDQKNISYEIIKISGCLEIPSIISIAKDSNKYLGYITLGCIIRGQTTHYDHICNTVISEITRMAVDHKLAIGNAILTVENQEQAIERADLTKKNKAKYAVNSCLEILNFKNSIK